MMRHTSNRHCAGFSLVEIMTVLVILAVASAIVLPQLGKNDDLRLGSATRELTADLLYAQSQAIATGRTMYVRFDASASSYGILESLQPTLPALRPGSSEPYAVDLTSQLPGVEVKSVQLDGGAIVAFDAMGTPLSAGGEGASLQPLRAGSIVLGAADETRTISIHPMTGAIQVR